MQRRERNSIEGVDHFDENSGSLWMRVDTLTVPVCDANVPPMFQSARTGRPAEPCRLCKRAEGLLWIPGRETGVNPRRRLERRRPRKSPDPPTSRNPGDLERNTGFEPATFALATSQPGIHESPLPSTNLHEPLISLASAEHEGEPGFTNLHADSRASCAQRVPGRSSRALSARPLNVAQVAELLGFSRAHVYDLCGRNELPHFRDADNSLRFDCKLLGRMLRAKRRTATGSPAIGH
jgi:Helix-turn-helix domain